MSQAHVIALHCSGGSAGQWRHLKRMLPSETPLWCPHFIGSTWTGHWSGNHAFTLADEAAPIVAMIDSLGLRVHLVGHSYGGAVALRVARERPAQIASMVLYEPTALHVLNTAGPDGRTALDEVNSFSATIDRAILAGDHRTAAKQFVDYWSDRGTWATLRGEAQADVIHYMPKASLDFRALRFERTPLAVYRHFGFPALLLTGQHAREPVQVIARQLTRSLRFGVPQTVDGAGHMGPLTHANAVAGLMAGFIKQHDDASVIENAGAVSYSRAA
jgi:pimeloyl-ACP methyl ester carboxylesterase